MFTIGNHTKQRPIATQRSGESALDPDGLLEPKLNECFLYHGTKSEVAELVATHGFDERVGSLDGLIGSGVYFANQSCKSAQYTTDENGLRTILICRVALGDPHYAQGALQQARRPPERTTAPVSKGLTFDSVVANTGGRQVHREFIVYDHRQAYPEYIVKFKP